MLIRLTANVRLVDFNDRDFQPSAATLGYFFHEYFHYVHNLSTASGATALFNTVKLWTEFRRTFEDGRFSQGSTELPSDLREYLQTLSEYLDAARRCNIPKLTYTLNPKHVEITSARLQLIATQAHHGEPLLHEIVCSGRVYDQEDNAEAAEVRVGTLEILECAAWLLEKRIVEALDYTATVIPPPVFPNRVVEALVTHLEPKLDEDAVLACALVSLQNSDAPEELLRCILLAANELKSGKDPVLAMHRYALVLLDGSKGALEAIFQTLQREFSGANVFATAVRSAIGTARRLFELRIHSPLFELDIISRLSAAPDRYATEFQKLAPCAVLQECHGDDDELQRDSLISFLPPPTPGEMDPEDVLRVFHSAFHFMSAHRTEQGFRATDLARGRCPFYTSCALKMRREAPELCLKTPWAAADWDWRNDKLGACWYGTGVRLTRPPAHQLPRSASRGWHYWWGVIKRWLMQRLRIADR